MNSFAEAMKREENGTRTENGAYAIKSTGDACLNFYSVIGALRNEDRIDYTRAEILFSEAYKENPLLAVKTIFYARDVRGGLGERDVVRHLLAYAATYHPEAIINNMDLIGVYGRYDDLYCFVGTPLEDKMWAAMKTQFEEDLANLEDGNAISLLAKWIKTPDASSAKTRKLGILTAIKLGYKVKVFKRILRNMRRRINIVESYMSTNQWDKIKYSEVPSRAMMIYRSAFARHDGERFSDYVQSALKGEEKINSATLYPYDIVEKYFNGYSINLNPSDADVLEAQWRQLPNYVESGNVLVMADVSGSMMGRPMASSIGLAMYFAERNKGAFHNLFMTFSDNPTLINIEGETLAQKIYDISESNWGFSTDLYKAFEKVLDIAIKYNIPSEEMPVAITVITDMEINQCSNRDWLFYDEVKALFASHGYEIPNVVFWNVNSRHDVFHSDSNRKGVQLVSGHSTSTFKNLIDCLNMTPVEAMLKTLNSERYLPITIA